MNPVVLVGSDFEENLSLRYLAAMVEAAGHSAELVPWSEGHDLEALAQGISAMDPLLVGISIPFQSTAPSALQVGPALRAAGCQAHICVGGHFITFEYENVLRDFPHIDSAVRHEGEGPFLTLCDRLRDGESPLGIPGLSARGDGEIFGSEKHPLPPLDTLPFPDRRGEPHQVMGVRTSPILGSRGCFADCTFCCIFAYSDNAKGPRYRRRSPANILQEMRTEYRERGVRLFVFHDDNFLVPSRTMNLQRVGEMSALLRAEGMDDIGLVIKCRPNDVDEELFQLLKSMGLIRAYVGIETNSDEGIVSLNRRITFEDNERALQILDDLDIYHSFNMLIFDPEATLAGVEKNLDFMERHAHVPFNFCRAEVYAGTPLKKVLKEEGRLEGDYFAWNYRMRDPRVELLFRIATTAFHTRNFKSDGMANLNMGLRFDGEVVRRFYPATEDEAWRGRFREFSRTVGVSTVGLVRDAIAFVRESDLTDHAAAKAFTIELARRVAADNLGSLRQCKTLRRGLEERVPSGALEPQRQEG